MYLRLNCFVRSIYFCAGTSASSSTRSSQLLDSVGNDFERLGVSLQSCGHLCHVSCMKTYLKAKSTTVSVFSPDEIILNPTFDEFRCPQCRRLSNVLIPCVPCASVRTKVPIHSSSGNSKQHLRRPMTNDGDVEGDGVATSDPEAAFEKFVEDLAGGGGTVQQKETTRDTGSSAASTSGSTGTQQIAASSTSSPHVVTSGLSTSGIFETAEVRERLLHQLHGFGDHIEAVKRFRKPFQPAMTPLEEEALMMHTLAYNIANLELAERDAPAHSLGDSSSAAIGQSQSRVTTGVLERVSEAKSRPIEAMYHIATTFFAGSATARIAEWQLAIKQMLVRLINCLNLCI